ncbi:MAG: hypothetical protein GY753_11875 [Gammaproteobacteria bacterium]|nr:hypothetical protein [Gammaproteobacteria bacterium]
MFTETLNKNGTPRKKPLYVAYLRKLGLEKKPHRVELMPLRLAEDKYGATGLDYENPEREVAVIHFWTEESTND